MHEGMHPEVAMTLAATTDFGGPVFIGIPLDRPVPVEITENFFMGEPSRSPHIGFVERDGRNTLVVDGLFLMALELAAQMNVTTFVTTHRGRWRRIWHAIARFALRRVAGRQP
jgi:hypothetical protein